MNINVLMPVFNPSLPWLSEAVDSIVYQDHPNFNLVIVDDNNPRGEVTDYFDRINRKLDMVKVVRKNTNEGIAGALDFGLQYCNGDLIVRMDCDDIAYPSLLSGHDTFFSKNPDKDICGVQLHLFNGTSDWYSNHPYAVDRSLAFAMPGHWFVNHPGIAYRKQAITSVGGYGNIPANMAEDYALWIKFLLAGYIMYNQEAVRIDYRVHPKSFSFAPDRKSREYLDFLEQQKNLLQ